MKTRTATLSDKLLGAAYHWQVMAAALAYAKHIKGDHTNDGCEKELKDFNEAEARFMDLISKVKALE